MVNLCFEYVTDNDLISNYLLFLCNMSITTLIDIINNLKYVIMSHYQLLLYDFIFHDVYL